MQTNIIQQGNLAKNWYQYHLYIHIQIVIPNIHIKMRHWIVNISSYVSEKSLDLQKRSRFHTAFCSKKICKTLQHHGNSWNNMKKFGPPKKQNTHIFKNHSQLATNFFPFSVTILRCILSYIIQKWKLELSPFFFVHYFVKVEKNLKPKAQTRSYIKK